MKSFTQAVLFISSSVSAVDTITAVSSLFTKVTDAEGHTLRYIDLKNDKENIIDGQKVSKLRLDPLSMTLDLRDTSFVATEAVSESGNKTETSAVIDLHGTLFCFEDGSKTLSLDSLEEQTSVKV